MVWCERQTTTLVIAHDDLVIVGGNGRHNWPRIIFIFGVRVGGDTTEGTEGEENRRESGAGGP